MARQSLLEITQEILSALDSDEVNSIEDTIESRQVAKIVRRVFNDMISRSNLPEHQSLFQLTASGDPLQPVLMIKPDNVKRIDWIKYDVNDEPLDPANYAYLDYRPLTMFLEFTHQLDVEESYVDIMDLEGFDFFYRNDEAPHYYTTVNDKYIVFDSFDSGMESTLQAHKTIGFGLIGPTFSMQDNYFPEIDEPQFPLLINEAKSLAFYELKQVAHEKAEQESRRQWRTMQKSKDLKQGSSFDNLPDYSRSGHGIWRRISRF